MTRIKRIVIRAIRVIRVRQDSRWLHKVNSASGFGYSS